MITDNWRYANVSPTHLQSKVSTSRRDVLEADLPMSTRSERHVWRFRSFTDLSETVVDLLSARAVRVQGGGGNSVLLRPSGWVPRVRLWPQLGVHGRDTGCGHDEVAFGDHVAGRLAGCREGRRDRDGRLDFSVDRADIMVSRSLFIGIG